MATMTKRHPVVPTRRIELSESQWEVQKQKGLYTVVRGEPMAIPVDRIGATTFLNRDLWRQDKEGRVFRPGAKMTAPDWPLVRKFWEAMPENVRILRNMIAYGHDVHVSTHADLYAKHWHAGWANPFNPDKIDAPLDPAFRHECDMGSTCPVKNMVLPSQGFLETAGWVSGAKVTKAFVNVEVGALADAAASGEAGEFNDFNEHEVGTDSTAEANTQTALIASSGIALAAGTQVDNGGDPPTYTSVATITADATETWEEHGVLSTSVDTLLDRSLTGGQSVNSSDQVQYTYTLTCNPES